MVRFVCVLAYLGLIGSLFTGVYHPFTVGNDRSWLIVVVFAIAHVALGAAWRSNWSFAFPPVIALAGVLVASAAHNPWVVMAAIVGVPTALALIASGRLLGWAARRTPAARLATWLLPGLLFLAAAFPLADAARESYHLATGTRLPAAEARQLPLAENTLSGLCDPSALPGDYRSELTQARALVREAAVHGDLVVHTTYRGSDENAGEHNDVMTVRQLAQNQLENLREFPRCEPGLQHALEDAIG
jgi:hypothetical protein